MITLVDGTQFPEWNERWYYRKDKGAWECPNCHGLVTKQWTEHCPFCNKWLYWCLAYDGTIQAQG